MSKGWKITVGVAVVVVIVGAGLLRWGGMVYWTSGGERGWSLGATMYELLGWEAETYRTDFGAHERAAEWLGQLEVELVDDDGDDVPDRGVIQVPKGEVPVGPVARFGLRQGTHLTPGAGLTHGWSFHHTQVGRFGRAFWPLRVIGGLVRLAFFALLVGLGVFFICRRRKTQSTSASSQSDS